MRGARLYLPIIPHYYIILRGAVIHIDNQHIPAACSLSIKFAHIPAMRSLLYLIST